MMIYSLMIDNESILIMNKHNMNKHKNTRFTNGMILKKKFTNS